VLVGPVCPRDFIQNQAPAAPPASAIKTTAPTSDGLLERATRSALTVCTASAASELAAGARSESDAVAIGTSPTSLSRNTMRTLPKSTWSAWARRCSDTRSAPTRVPLVEPRSRRSTPSESTTSSAWRPETEASRTWIALPGLRPTLAPLPVIGIVSPRRSVFSKRRA
jgi:hypothetical protein